MTNSVAEAILEAVDEADTCPWNVGWDDARPCLMGYAHRIGAKHHLYHHLALALHRLLREVATEAFLAGVTICTGVEGPPKSGSIADVTERATVDRLCGPALGEGGTK